MPFDLFLDEDDINDLKLSNKKILNTTNTEHFIDFLLKCNNELCENKEFKKRLSHRINAYVDNLDLENDLLLFPKLKLVNDLLDDPKRFGQDKLEIQKFNEIQHKLSHLRKIRIYFDEKDFIKNNCDVNKYLDSIFNKFDSTKDFTLSIGFHDSLPDYLIKNNFNIKKITNATPKETEFELNKLFALKNDNKITDENARS
jgi:hypothetical protein